MSSKAYLYVAVLRYPDNGEYQPSFKVGITDFLDKRIRKISTTRYPADVELLCAFDMSQSTAEAVERSLHQKYKPQRIAGEWFRADKCFYVVADEIAAFVESKGGKEIDVPINEEEWSMDRPEAA